VPNDRLLNTLGPELLMDLCLVGPATGFETVAGVAEPLSPDYEQIRKWASSHY
jgi:hypothetical protein